MSWVRIRVWLLVVPTLGWPSALAAQNTTPGGSFRPYLYVLVAFAAGWIVVGAWVFQISRKVIELSKRMDES